MKRLISLGFVTALILSSPSLAGAQASYVCGMGTVRGVQTVTDPDAKRTSPGVAERRMMRFDGGTLPGSRSDRQGSYLVAIQLDDVVYTGRSSRIRAGMADRIRPVINRKIPTCIDEGELVFGRSDARSTRTTIVRAIRVAKLEPVSLDR
jgi:hypothetical protein